MAQYLLQNQYLDCQITTQGGAVLNFQYREANHVFSVLRDAAADRSRLACFPLVPFGNRLWGNTFQSQGHNYRLAPNVTGEAYYLHGDAWLGNWQLTERSAARVQMSFTQQASEQTPYAYQAQQSFQLQENALCLSLQVQNCGAATLPFGLGWHPYFNLLPGTQLQAVANHYAPEGEQHRPLTWAPLPRDLDFNQLGELPNRWVNNGFTGWDGRALIQWPSVQLQVELTTDVPLAHYFLFRPDRAYDVYYAGDYFCFEPMTHAADAHQQPDLGGLRLLPPGESMSTRLCLRVSRLDASMDG